MGETSNVPACGKAMSPPAVGQAISNFRLQSGRYQGNRDIWNEVDQKMGDDVRL